MRYVVLVSKIISNLYCIDQRIRLLSYLDFILEFAERFKNFIILPWLSWYGISFPAIWINTVDDSTSTGSMQSQTVCQLSQHGKWSKFWIYILANPETSKNLYKLYVDIVDAESHWKLTQLMWVSFCVNSGCKDDQIQYIYQPIRRQVGELNHLWGL